MRRPDSETGLNCAAQLNRIGHTGFEAWGRRASEIAVHIAYQNRALRGTRKRGWADCEEIPDAAILPAGYTPRAGAIAHPSIVLARYRLADMLKRLF
jgi:hypothetical protein